MYRLTKDDVNEMQVLNFLHNQVFIKDNEVWYRNSGTRMPLRYFIREMLTLNGIDYPGDNDEFDEYVLNLMQTEHGNVSGMIALLYNALLGFANVRESLKKYEDKEEQGLLISLPFEDKTAVYVPDYEYNKVYESIVNHRNTQIKNGTCRMAISIPDHMGMLMHFTEEDLGKTVFTTREAAMEALEKNGTEIKYSILKN